MRSRHNKTRRSRISPIDRLIQTPVGNAIVVAIKSSRRTSSIAQRSIPQRLTAPVLPISVQELEASVSKEKPEKYNSEAVTTSDDSDELTIVSLSESKTDEFKTEFKTNKPNHKSPLRPTIKRSQSPGSWWPIIALILTWIVMLEIIWRSFQEIISLGASPTQQSIGQLERKALLEFLFALCLGGMGLCLALTPRLKRHPRGNHVSSLPASLDPNRDK